MKNNRIMISEIAEALHRYCKNEINTSEENKLVKIATSIAQQKLWGRLWAASQSQGTTIEQQALSVTGVLFYKRDSISPLKTALEEYMDLDDTSLYLRFKSVVIKNASQELYYRWSENDPQSARLRRTLQRVLRHDSRITIFPIDKPEFVTLSNVDDLKQELRQVAHDNILKIMSGIYKPGILIPDLIVESISQIFNMPSNQNVIRTEILFSAIRYILKQSKIEEMEYNVTCNAPNPLLALALERAAESATQTMHVLLNKYLNNKKLEYYVVKYYESALRDILEDCQDGGPAQSYYEYLNKYWPELSLANYRTLYRSKFEYLVDKIQNIFFKAVRDQFIE